MASGLNNSLPSTEEGPPTDNMELRNQQHDYRFSVSKTTIHPAVKVENALKYYGSKKSPIIVLDKLNMTVAKGTIYGLLGASGCGKTTLLNCILGRKKLNSGEVRVFGGSPREALNGKSRFGYMPQEIGLYADFTVKETLIYFGWIVGMNNQQIQERCDNLIKLIAIPETEQRIKTLSGGEQRRVSLAVVLLHEPELLILDEPTVGVDTLLRETIWHHLEYLSKTRGTTVILTTHYIEEARKANTIALMRGGKLLAEESPQELILRYDAHSLEDVFLKLSILQNNNHQDFLERRRSVDEISVKSIESRKYSEMLTKPPILALTKKTTFKIRDCLPTFNMNHMKALLWKNALWWIRNTPSLVFMVTLAFTIITFVYFSLGGYPHDLVVAVVSRETNNSLDCDNAMTCESTQLSCHFLSRLKENYMVLKSYNSEEEARESVFNGDTVAAIIIKHNYSDALRSRIDDMQYSSSWNIEYSEVDVVRDTNDIIVSRYIKYYLYEAFKYFIQDYLVSCELSPKFLSIPVQINEPVYGLEANDYTKYVLTGMLISIAFFMGTLLTSGTMLVERSEASLERSLVIGITETELLFAHLICEFGVSLVQSIIGVITTYCILDTTYTGSIILALCLTTLVGFSGMTFGIFLSSITDSDIFIFLVSMASMYIFMCVGGVLWPVEGGHYALQYFSPYFPLTQPIQSLRSIMNRNWGLFTADVALGFISISMWTAIFLTISILATKFRKT